MYQLIALDLDGTLLASDNTISPYNRQVLQACRQKGAVVTLSTGRMYPSALPFAQSLALDDVPLITYHGALIRYADGRTLRHLPLADDLAERVREILAPFAPHMRYYADDQLYMSDLGPEAMAYARHIGITPHLLPQDVAALHPTKMAVVDSAERIAQYMTLLQRALGEQIYMTKVSEGFLEISDPRGTKGHALAAVAEHYGIARERVIAFGDSYNDLPMLQYAGCAVAMANGCQVVKQQADRICAANDNDGVGRLLAEVFAL